ncbi:hypothetical protein YC2023_081753 [Brassica napus]
MEGSPVLALMMYEASFLVYREVYLELTTPRNKKCSTKNKGDKLNKRGKKVVLFRGS